MTSALLLGATGQTGGHVLKELLASSHFTRVAEFGRKVTPAESLQAREKLQQKVIDFEKLDEGKLNEGKWDVVFITLGTTKAAAGSAAAFEKIDKEYVINAARAAKSTDASHSQRLIYVSAQGANASSSFLYPRCKGQTENALASLGYAETIVFRPGMLAGTNRPQPRLVEKVAGFVTGALAHVTASIEITVADLAKSIVYAGQHGVAGLPPAAKASEAVTPEGAKFTIVANAGAVALSRL